MEAPISVQFVLKSSGVVSPQSAEPEAHVQGREQGWGSYEGQRSLPHQLVDLGSVVSSQWGLWQSAGRQELFGALYYSGNMYKRPQTEMFGHQ